MTKTTKLLIGSIAFAFAVIISFQAFFMFYAIPKNQCRTDKLKFYPFNEFSMLAKKLPSNIKHIKLYGSIARADLRSTFNISTFDTAKIFSFSIEDTARISYFVNKDTLIVQNKIGDTAGGYCLNSIHLLLPTVESVLVYNAMAAFSQFENNHTVTVTSVNSQVILGGRASFANGSMDRLNYAFSQDSYGDGHQFVRVNQMNCIALKNANIKSGQACYINNMVAKVDSTSVINSSGETYNKIKQVNGKKINLEKNFFNLKYDSTQKQFIFKYK